jgi:TetR/AcrR family transcriptional regulator
MTTTMERRTRDAARSREAILNAAEQLFADHGYQGTSLQDVGDAAGVSRGTPSYFFGSKEGLYRSVLERMFGDVRELMREQRRAALERAEAPEGVIVSQVTGYIDFLASRPNFVRLLQWEALTGARITGELGMRINVLQEVERVVAEEVETGKLRGMNARHLLLNLIALCWFPFAQRDGTTRTLGFEAYDPAFVEAHKREVVALVLEGIRHR